MSRILTGIQSTGTPHLGNILGRTYEEVLDFVKCFSSEENPLKFFNLIYWLGKLAINEVIENNKRTVTFSSVLVEEIGHHIYGEIWANNIKKLIKRITSDPFTL